MDDFSIISIFVAFFCLPPLLLLFIAFAAGEWFENEKIKNEKTKVEWPDADLDFEALLNGKGKTLFSLKGKGEILPEEYWIHRTFFGTRIRSGSYLADIFDTSDIPKESVVDQVRLRVSFPEKENVNEN